MKKRLPHIVFILLLLLRFTAMAQEGFVENKGQWPEQVRYQIQVPGGSLFLEDSTLTFWLFDPVLFEFFHPSDNQELPPDSLKSHVYKVHLLGAHPQNTVGEKQLEPYYNYFVGNPSNWASEAHAFDRVVYQHAYPGIDLKFYQKTNSLKYDFVVQPHGSVDDIQIEYEGLDKLEIRRGVLHLHTSVGVIKELKPFAYQFIDGKVEEVECRYKLDEKTVSFTVGKFNPNFPLVIDPEVSFATYIGTTASNFGFTATDDSNGNLIAGADVFASGYPTTVGAVQSDFVGTVNSYCDIAVSKFSADGNNLLYSTYLGGGGLEMPHSVVADSNDNWIVMGTTGSLNFPTTTGAYQTGLQGGPFYSFSSFFIPASHINGCDFFVSKFSADGTGLLASTYVGPYGTDGLNTGDKLFYNYGDVFRGEVIVDEFDNVFVTSTTQSTDFPTTPNAPQTSFGGGTTDAVVFQMGPNLDNIAFCTYWGGSGDDSGYSIQFDSNNNLILVGGTKSSDLPTTTGAVGPSFNGDVDGFVVKFNNTWTGVLASSYVGTSNYDQCYFTQVDSDNFIYVLGQTDGNMPIVGNVYANPNSGQFITKFNGDLTNVEWSTSIGTGSGHVDISPTAFLISDCKQVYFTGWGGLTNSNNSPYANWSTTFGMPTTSDAYQSSTDGSDFYLCVLAPDATDLEYGTFFGGPSSHEHVDGGTSKFDKNGQVYQAVCAGCGGNSDFPTTPGAWSATNNSSNCNLGVFKFDLSAIQAVIDIDGPTQVCEGQPAQFINNSQGGTDYLWTFGNDGTSTDFEPQFVFQENGTVTVQLVVTDNQGCLEEDVATLQIEVIPGVNPSIAPVDPVCEGESVQLMGTGSENIFWLNDPTLSATDIPNPIATPTSTTTYFLVDQNACESDTVSVVVNFVNVNTTVSDDTALCIGESTVLEATGGQQYSWEPAIFLSNPNISNPTATPTETTTFYVSITTSEGCAVSDSLLVTVDQNPPGGLIYEPVNLCTGFSVELEAAPGMIWSWSPENSLDNPQSQNPTASPTSTTVYTVVITNSCGQGSDEVTVNVITPVATSGDDGTVCLGQWYPVWAEGGVEFQWSPPQYAANPNQASTAVSPPESMTMTVYVTDEFGCVATDEVFVNILPLPEVNAGPNRKIDWVESANLFGYSSEENYWWTPDTWISCTDCLEPEVQPDESIFYFLHAEDVNGCVATDSVFVEVFYPIYIPNTVTPDGDGINDFFRAYGDNIHNFHMEIYDRWGQMVFQSDDIETVWDGGMNGGDYYVQIDTYVWMIWFDALEGRRKLMGSVNVVR